MIRLKNGREIEYNKDFDVFFQSLLGGIIEESLKTVNEAGDALYASEDYNKALLKEIMDNSIFVTHQIFELRQLNENLAKFLVSGFLFNSLVLSIPNLNEVVTNQETNKGETIH